jgi:hypothetical protein
MPTTIERSVKRKDERSLRDRLSRLTFPEACKLLGADGSKLIRTGGAYEIDIHEDVRWAGDLFRLRLNDAVVTITMQTEARDRLRWNCTRCSTACEHVGAAFSLILEEKTALGLAAPPTERKPMESLTEEELVRAAVDERWKRAREERMSVRSVDSDRLWTDYVVTNTESGKTYRVALRGWEAGESFCSCPDFRKNTLGVCKHILHVQHKAKARFPKTVRQRPYRQTEFAVHLRYGSELELRLLTPAKMEPAAEELIRPIRTRVITDVRDLLKRVTKLTSLGQEVTVYPDAEEYIKRQLFQTDINSKVTEIRRDPRIHPLRRGLMKVELLPYQLDGVAFAVGAARAILANEMGLGKTIQGIGVAEMLAREAGITKVLIVCPASLKSQWRSEINRFADRDCQLVAGSAEERVRQYKNECFFTVCNYEQVLRDILAIEQASWDLIILDEGQRIKNWEAKTSRVIKGLKSPFALVLTGTPLENRLDDLFSIVEFIDDCRLGPAFRFFNRHRIVDEKGKVLGYKNLQELRERLKPILLRRTRASVALDLPPRTTEIIRIAPTEEQLEIHRANMKTVSQIVRKKFISEMDLLRLRKALLMCRMAADSTFLVDKQKPGHSSKLEALDDLFETLFQDEQCKVILFSEWTTMLDLIEPLIKERELAYVRLDGSVPQKQRQALVQRFQTDSKCRLFITTNAGSTGLNLQAANTVINVDLPWNPAVLEQRIARAHRMGQRNPVQAYVLVAEQTIEESLLSTLSAKRDLAIAALDPDAETDQVDLATGNDELKRRLEILLGEKPAAPIDNSAQISAVDEAERLARKERVSLAGGRLLSAAVSWLGEMFQSPEPTHEAGRLVQDLPSRLGDCLDRDSHGRPRLTFTLPDDSALAALSSILARILTHEE